MFPSALCWWLEPREREPLSSILTKICVRIRWRIFPRLAMCWCALSRETQLGAFSLSRMLHALFTNTSNYERAVLSLSRSLTLKPIPSLRRDLLRGLSVRFRLTTEATSLPLSLIVVVISVIGVLLRAAFFDRCRSLSSFAANYTVLLGPFRPGFIIGRTWGGGGAAPINACKRSGGVWV